MMFVFLRNGIKGHKALFGGCVLASFILYMATLIILTYYCNIILKNEDADRYCYYDISLPNVISFEELDIFEAAVQQEFSGVVEAVCYTVTLDGFWDILIVPSGGEAVECGLDTVPEVGALVDPDMADDFHIQYPEIQYQTETKVIAYGCQPDFFSAIMLYEDAAEYFTGSGKMIIRMSRALKAGERRKLGKLLSKYVSGYEVNYVTRMGWIRQGISYCGYYIIFSICIYVYTLICIMMLLYQMMRQQRKEVLVYLACGANKGFLKKYMMLEVLLTQAAAAIISCICAYVCMPWISAIDVSRQFAIPYLAVLISAVASLSTAVFVAGKYERDYA